MSSGQIFLRVPVNPRLKFCVSLDEVYDRDALHPGLRDLLFKSYLSASGNDGADEELFKGGSKTPYVLKALRAGPKGQGRLKDRMSLKLKLESGKWIVATQTPAGTPVWVLRHFLGCLPQPLLHESHWGMIAIACGKELRSKTKDYKLEIFEEIVTALEALPRENYLTLVALLQLIRNLSTVTPNDNSDAMTLHEEALEALSLYFTAAIISRPYRPGLHTMVDKEHKPLLLFLSEHWLEIEKLCRHTGVSRYRRTSQSPCEFVSLDSEVDHTLWQTAAAEDNHDQIHLHEESIARKSNRRPSRIGMPHRSRILSEDENLRISRKEAEEINETETSYIQNNEIQRDSLSASVHTPKDVYFISPNVEYIRKSITDEVASGMVMEDSSDTVKLADTKFDRCYVQLKVPGVNGPEGHPLGEGTSKDESNSISNSYVQKSMGKYKGEATVFTGTNEAFKCDGRPTQKEVMGKVNVKINGTQTFECEFCEGSLITMGAGELQEKMDESRVSGSSEEILQTRNKREFEPEEKILAAVIFGSTNVFKFVKIREKGAAIPLTESTALLIKNLPRDREIVYFPATTLTVSDFIDVLGNGKVIDEVEEVITPKEELFTENTDGDVDNTLTNSANDTKELKYAQKSNSKNKNDFVSELKDNFRKGLKRPSDAKLSSQIMPVDEVGSWNENRTSHVQLADSCGSTQQLFPKTFGLPTSSVNSL